MPSFYLKITVTQFSSQIFFLLILLVCCFLAMSPFICPALLLLLTSTFLPILCHVSFLIICLNSSSFFMWPMTDHSHSPPPHGYLPSLLCQLPLSFSDASNYNVPFQASYFPFFFFFFFVKKSIFYHPPSQEVSGVSFSFCCYKSYYKSVSLPLVS